MDLTASQLGPVDEARDDVLELDWTYLAERPRVEEINQEDREGHTEARMLDQIAQGNGSMKDELLLDQEFDPVITDFEEAESLGHDPFVVVSLGDHIRSSPRPQRMRRRSRLDLVEAPKPAQDLVVTTATMTLAEHLAHAREMAERVIASEARSRKTLYEALSCAYDLALSAGAAEDEFAELLAEAGIMPRSGAADSAIVKLVFGVEYDKTRISEYSLVISHGRRLGLTPGSLARFVESIDGGVKEIVKRERTLRRGTEKQAKQQRSEMKTAIVQRLEAMPRCSLADLPREGEDYVLVLANRIEDGTLQILGDVPHNLTLVERAATIMLKDRL